MHILLVDDDEMVRDLFCIFLERAGIGCTAVGNEEELAAALASGTKCDGAIVDHSTLGWVHNEDQTLKLEMPVIYITGLLREDIVNEVGVDAIVITKPMDMNYLKTIIQSVFTSG